MDDKKPTEIKANEFLPETQEEASKMLADIASKVERLKHGKKYSDELKRMVVAYINQGNSYGDAVRAFNLNSKSAVHRWMDAYAVDCLGESAQDLIEQYKRSLQVKYLRNADILTDEAMDADKLSKGSTLQLMTASGICIDKAQNIEKGSNSLFNVNVAINNVGKNEDELGSLEKELAEVTARLQAQGPTIEAELSE